MDPSSIVGLATAACAAAKGAWDVSEGLYNFVRDAKRLDSTESAFATEVKALGAACEMVESRLLGIVKDFDNLAVKKEGTSSDSDLLWKCLAEQVAECRATVGHLKDAVPSFRNTNGHDSGIFGQAFHQIKLSLKAKSIEQARNRVRSHTASLQLVLQAISIEIFYVSQNRAYPDLQLALEELAKSKRDLESLRAEREIGDTIQPDPREDEILRASSQVMSTVETLRATSAFGSVRGSGGENEKAVLDWMGAMYNFELFGELPKASASDIQFGSHVSIERTPASAPMTIPEANGDEHKVEEDGDLDSEDGCESDVALIAMSSGRAAFQERDFDKAGALLRETLVLVDELPTIRRAGICDPCELRYMLGVCAFHTQDPHIAEIVLLRNLEAAAKAKEQDDARKLQTFEAAYLLSKTYLRLGDLDRANFHCRNALIGRKRLLGKESDAYYESLALTATILGFEESKRIRQQLVRDLIPEEKRASLFSSLQGLGDGVEFRPQRTPTDSRKSSTIGNSVNTPRSTIDPQQIESPRSSVSTGARAIALNGRPAIAYPIGQLPFSPSSPSSTIAMSTSHTSSQPSSDEAGEVASSIAIESEPATLHTPIATRPASRPNLRFHISRAKNIIQPRFYKAPNPFVRIFLGNQQQICTQIQSQTTQPCWDYIFDAHVCGTENIRFDVVNAKKRKGEFVRTNDPERILGTAFIQLGDCFDVTNGGTAELALDLQYYAYRSPSITKGRLYVTLTALLESSGGSLEAVEATRVDSVAGSSLSSCSVST